MWKTDGGGGGGGGEGRKHCFINFCSLGLFSGAVGWGRKSYLGPADILSLSSRDLSRLVVSVVFWLVVSNGYFYILFLWAIVSDFPPFEIQKHLFSPLSSITFTANSQTDNHFSKSIYLFRKYYTVIVCWKNWKWSVWYISNGIQKKVSIEKSRFFSVDYVKINE